MTLDEVLQLVAARPAPRLDLSGLLDELQRAGQQRTQPVPGFADEMAAYHEEMHTETSRVGAQAAQPHTTVGAVAPFKPADWTKALPRSGQSLLDTGPLMSDGPPMLLDRSMEAVTGMPRGLI